MTCEKCEHCGQELLPKGKFALRCWHNDEKWGSGRVIQIYPQYLTDTKTEPPVCCPKRKEKKNENFAAH